MRPHRGAAALLALIAACASSGDDDGSVTCDDLVPGDLVLTEVMANPTGEDDGGEWFELYNAASGPIDLAGVELVAAKSDGGDEKVHVVGELVIQPDDYVVAGDVLPDLKPAWVDYGYANDLGSLVNGGGRLALRCDGVEIDALDYPEAPGADGGVSSILDGNLAPDHLANDEVANLCASTSASAIAAGVIGSPGEANEACDLLVPGTCVDGGEPRAVVSPGPGDLVISEFMPSPDVVSDAAGEWFEVYVAATVDLNGVVAGRSVGTPQASVSGTDCVTAAAGSYVLFARSADPAANGGLPEVDATFNFSLVGGSAASPGSIFVGLGDQVLDEVSWTDSASGAATALDPARLDPAANDDPANFAACEAPYGADGNAGTPGEPNDACTVAEGTCDDGGTFRAVVPPTAGQILVTEVMANPTASSEGPQEWFEITVTADVDLNGLEIGKVSDPYTVADTITSTTCLAVAAGSRIVFARDDDAATNGGLRDDVVLFDMTLTNSNSQVFVGHGGALLDALAWTSTRNGAARALDPDGSSVCDAEATYGPPEGLNLGSPGDANPTSTTQCAPR